MRGEVMWPRLVASKLLRKTLGSNNFVADFPGNTYSFLDLPTLDLEPVPSPKILLTDYHDTQKFKVFVSTWNVGGVAPTDDLNIDDLLDTSNTTCDIYVLGFQEVVPLRASNVLGSDKKKISMKWNSLIRKTLNKKSHDRNNNNNNLSEKQRVTKGKKSNTESSMIQPEFRCLISKQMVGIMISVWVRSDLHPFFRNPNVSCVGCGIMGCLGNKGSVSVRFQFHETSFCFVCVHLASGGREGDERVRNSNATEIFSRTSFPTVMGPSLDLPKTILDHDRVVLLGDLNYRISLPESETRLLVNRKDWNTLLENDQLRMELMDGQAFEAWHEGTISFAPTYKYQLNCDEYYGCGHLGTKPKKKRAPAWCDRIIWTGEGSKQLLYTRSETRLSDHRPVKALFSIEVKVSRTTYRSFCLSERFGCQPRASLDFHSDDEYSGLLSYHMKSKMTP
ncbi:putative endonuclease/exonuclease/phosphatase [Helianthus annuus]|uniref:Endonuclease/exonuclease/phosphatase n=1 Tax=Helianthus annuus TaxID=4232 RepID=A0A251RU62_HELAN|nr:type IV inositol polyphosphate 5-phosphatase 9 [Helianthus annuus]KAF5757390.1 putative endonuclease/exonuclease/phosphatase [Helianthus annuus]KAJ0828370.1 putative endonuclease/exonuclease/phosphatase [Helianthus annuus]